MATTIETKYEVALDIRVKCSECGAELEAEYSESTSYGRTTMTLSVEVCGTCLDRTIFKAKEEGRAEGKDEASLPPGQSRCP